ncbi:sugar phosphate isomerase/epimerase family protein [Adhaeribacter aquaticus]|uniref:sugar phosphate isomerase/epimerase family protein n=1 Tax=Adhaeribacter aquaticus TaxID=299567 RepID=UPI000409BA73|nr:TIM barrel protein [Adhaeribacter aquaticus]
MKRREFIFKSSGLVLSAWVAPSLSMAFQNKNKMDRIAMGTVLFRYRFKQTKPAELTTIKNELTLLDVPSFYRDRFGINKVEFWSTHFESLEQPYLDKLKGKLTGSRSKLINVQVDTAYNLASTNEDERLRSIDHVKKWMDAVAFLGSPCIRINPGNSGSVEKSIQSLKEVNKYAMSKKLVLLNENHFGIEMNPDVHLRIRQEAGPKNIYTLPDFGNYPHDTMYQSLEKIMPHAYLISAKADEFNANMEHVSYDFDRCVQMAEKHGFKGIYSVEQWNRNFQDIDYEKVGDWLIEHVKRNIKA